MKRLLYLISSAVIIFTLNSCQNNKNQSEYYGEKWFSEPIIFGNIFYDDAEPLINGFNGEKFASRNITADGYYTGYTTLRSRMANIYGRESFGEAADIIYCEDDGSIIWRNLYGNFYQNGIVRMKKDGEVERLCVVEECRANLNAHCTHMNGFYQNMSYSDGILYLAVHNDHYDESSDRYIDPHSYILMYDIQAHKIQKLIDDSGEDKAIGFGLMNMNGRYIYLTDSTGLIRIDLYEENAVILMGKNDLGLNKVREGRLYFYKGSVLSATENAVYMWDMDMTSYHPIVSYDDGKVIIKQIYGGSLYFFKYPNRTEPGEMPYELYRYDFKGHEDPVLLSGNIRDMYIADDIIYYTLYKEYHAFDYMKYIYEDESVRTKPKYELINHNVYNGNEIFGVAVDTDRNYVNWANSYTAYKPEGRDILCENGFTVKNGYLYTGIYIEKIDKDDPDVLVYYFKSVRVKPVANRIDYTFFEEYTQFRMF